MLALKPKQKIVFIGDSITDANRASQSPPLGNGYVRIASELLQARYPANQNVILNHGIGGNTVRDLEARWERDVLEHRPDWVSIKIGINDLWCWVVQRAGKSVSPAEFVEVYDRLIQRTTHAGAQVILVDPFFISSDFDAQTDRGRVLRELPAYIAVVAKLAKKHKLRRVKTHDAFQELLRFQSADSLCPEPVHPYLSGHTVIAYRWLEAMGW